MKNLIQRQRAAFDKEFHDIVNSAYWWRLCEQFKKFLTHSMELAADERTREILAAFQRVEAVKRAWEGVELNGNPNEQMLAQIFGFNQLYTILQEDVMPLLTTPNAEKSCCPECLFFNHPIKGAGRYCAKTNCPCHTPPLTEKGEDK